MNVAKRYLSGLTLALPMAIGATVASAQEGPLAEGHDKFLGSAYSPSQIENFAEYFNQVVSENAGKWGVVTNSAARPNGYSDEWFTADGNNSWAGGLDESFNFAKDNDLPYRMHVMVWGNQQPSWIAGLTEAEQREAIQEWFDVVSARYNDDRGGFDFVEVVNEPVNDAPDVPDDNGEGGAYKEALGGDGDTGWDWVITSFEMGREAFPNAKLMVNEYNVLSVDGVLASYLDIIDLLIERDLIDAIGVQAHAFSTADNSSADIKDHLDQLAERNLPIYITEMDIDGPGEQAQLDEYRRVFPIVWEHEAVAGVTLWGHNSGLWRTDEGAFLFDEEDGSERAAMVWLGCYMRSTAEGGSPSIFPAQTLEVPANLPAGGSVGEVMDCYGAESEREVDWSIVGGDGENVFTIDTDGQLSLADGQELEAGETWSVNVRMELEGVQGEAETVTITVGEESDDVDDSEGETGDEDTGNSGAPSAELPSGGGSSSSGSTHALFLMMLALLGSVRWMRRR